jgi:glycerol-3-phosphate dehydrogenase (NAD(P)+)
MHAVAEGVLTSRSAHRLAEKLGVDTPIISNTYKALHEGLAPRLALEALMNRPLKDELLL